MHWEWLAAMQEAFPRVSVSSSLFTLDRDRLYAEVALLAAKADIREEIDRLQAHVAALRERFGALG